MPGKPKKIVFEINENSCHVCTSHYSDNRKYPSIMINNKSWTLSRYIYTITYGEIPEGLIVRHKCDNMKCINPEHLELGTYLDNNQDRVKRGRNRNQTGDNHNMSKLSNNDIIDVYLSKEFHSDLAKKYKVHYNHIGLIKRGKRCQEITKHLELNPFDIRNTDKKSRNGKNNG